MRVGLPSFADKPRFVAAMFDRIAGRYDVMNTLMTGGQDRRWRGIVAAEALRSADADGRRVLDVGTGTGKLAMAIRQAWPGAQVVGVDFTDGMLRAAPPVAGLSLAGADALRLPFGDNQFDAVVSAFVVRNLADAAAGLKEQVRVLRTGGRLVVLETTPGPSGVLRPLFQLYFRHVVPLLGRLVAGDSSAYTYLPASTLAFSEPERLAQHLRSSGLVDVQVRRLALGSIGLTYGRKAAILAPWGAEE